MVGISLSQFLKDFGFRPKGVDTLSRSPHAWPSLGSRSEAPLISDFRSSQQQRPPTHPPPLPLSLSSLSSVLHTSAPSFASWLCPLYRGLIIVPSASGRLYSAGPLSAFSTPCHRHPRTHKGHLRGVHLINYPAAAESSRLSRARQ